MADCDKAQSISENALALFSFHSTLQEHRNFFQSHFKGVLRVVQCLRSICKESTKEKRETETVFLLQNEGEAAAYHNDKLNGVTTKLMREIKELRDQVRDLLFRVESNSVETVTS